MFQIDQNKACNHVKKGDKSPSGSGGAEFKTETVQTVETVDTGGGRGHYQDNLAFRSPEYETDQELSWPDRTESFEHERTSGSWSDSYDEGSRGSSCAQDPGYRIPYRRMRDPGDRERLTPPALSPPPQPTHRAPGRDGQNVLSSEDLITAFIAGLPPSYRKYSRTILVESSQQQSSRPSYVSTICVQPQSRLSPHSSQGEK